MSPTIPNAHRGSTGLVRKPTKNSTYIWIGVAVLFAIIFIGGCTSFNSMKKSEIAVSESWGNVQSAYQRRLQLIPNLVNTVKGIAAQEQKVILGATEARTGNTPSPLEDKVTKAGDELLAAGKQAAGGEFDPDGKSTVSAQAYENVDRALKVYVNAVHEAYPQVASSQNFQALQDELTGTENRIDKARVDYNKAVKEYNTAIGLFPKNIFAALFGFEQKQMYQADAGAMEAPTVDFTN